ncbi:MAG: XisH family protein [Spirulinaceae cyanobacterium]
MSRKDLFHDVVKSALEKEGWLITHDPFTIQISETVKLKIDLGAETTIAAQRGQEKIAVEIKNFVTDSEISEFHTALGQYLNYLQALEDKEPERVLYLAVPSGTYRDFFKIPFIQTTINRYALNLIVYDPVQEEIKQWLKSDDTSK